MKTLIYGKSSRWDKEIFYVSIENVEQIKEDTFQIFFDGIQGKKLDFYKRNTLLDSYNEIIPYIFSVTVSQEEYLKIMNFFKPAIFKSRWFQLIVTEKETELPVSIIIDNYLSNEDNTQEKFISSIKQLHSGSSINKTLNKYFSWDSFELSNPEQIIESLPIPNSNRGSFIHKLNIYNVGQGSLTAITDENNVPLLYFDLGGGFGVNKGTYPDISTLKLCFSYTKTVIVSHWDNDHLETARRYFKNNPSMLDGVTWIVPQQTITASFFKLAAKMNGTGNLIIWPKYLKGSLSFWFGKLIKCNGPDKNHSGIALVVESPDNSIRKVLNPADAAYKYIPTIRKVKFDGLVATHHGANFDDSNLPIPIPNSENGNIVYSYGTGNSYGHPKHTAVSAHFVSDWKNYRNTEDGNISFTTNSNILNVPCGSSQCTLDIVLTF